MPSETPLDIVESVHEFIGDILRAQRFFWFYPENHPSFAKVLNTLFLHFGNLSQEGSIIFSVSRERLSVGAIPLDLKRKNNHDFCSLLYKRRVQTVTFTPQVTPQELLSFVHILSLDSRMVRHHGGVIKILQDSGSTNIQVSEYVYDTGEFDSTQGSQNTSIDYLAGLSENHIRKFKEFLNGDLHELPMGYEDIFIEYLKNARRSLELIYQAALSRLDDSTHNDLGREIRRCLQRMRKWLNNYTPELKTSILRGLGLVILNERKDYHEYLFKGELTLDIDEVETVRQLFSDLSDDELLDYLLKEVPLLGSFELIKELIKKMAMSPLRVEQLMARFETIYLQKKNQIEEERRILSFQEQMKEITPTEIASDAVYLIMDIYENETLPLARMELLYQLERLIPHLVVSKMFKESGDILKLLDDEAASVTDDVHTIDLKELSRAIRFRLVNSELLKGLKKNITEINMAGDSEIVFFCQKLGEDGLRKFTEFILMPGGEYYYAAFFHFMGFMGDLIVPEAVKQLVEGKPELASNWMDLLQEIGTKEVSFHLQNVYLKVNENLRPQALKIIGFHKDPETRKWLTKIFHTDSDLKIRLASMEGLVHYEDEESRKMLKSWIFKTFGFNENNCQLQLRAIQLAGKNNTPEWVAVIKEVGFHKFIWPLTQRKKVRLSAIQTLGRMTLPEARQIIETGTRDKRSEIRGICESVLRMSADSLRGKERVS